MNNSSLCSSFYGWFDNASYSILWIVITSYSFTSSWPKRDLQQSISTIARSVIQLFSHWFYAVRCIHVLTQNLGLETNKWIFRCYEQWITHITVHCLTKSWNWIFYSQPHKFRSPFFHRFIWDSYRSNRMHINDFKRYFKWNYAFKIWIKWQERRYKCIETVYGLRFKITKLGWKCFTIQLMRVFGVFTPRENLHGKLSHYICKFKSKKSSSV